MLRPEEVELLVCGTEKLDLHELRKVTEYDGYRSDDSIIWYGQFSSYLNILFFLLTTILYFILFCT